MVPFLRIVAVLVAFYAVFASGSVAEETNTMVWALWIYGISIAYRIELINAETKGSR